jgi:glycosyltransferase involved in cell wall biosynthesis
MALDCIMSSLANARGPAGAGPVFAAPAKSARHVMFLMCKTDCNDGIFSYCMTLAAGLKEQGCKVYFVTSRISAAGADAERVGQLDRLCDEVLCVPGLGSRPKLSHWREIRAFMRRNAVDSVNVHGLGMILWGRLLSLFARVPVLATYHPSFHAGKADIVGRTRASLSLPARAIVSAFAVDSIVVLSEETRQQVMAECPPVARRVRKVVGAIDEGRFRPPTPEQRRAAREQLDIAEDEFICLQVGRLSWNKGIDLVVQATRMASARLDRPVRTIFVGSGGGEEEREIRDYAFQSEADHALFRFDGFKTDVLSYYWASDAFILPSRVEGYGLVVVEGMATGLVPIRTPGGGAADQIEDGETGLLVDFEDTEGLADAIIRLSDETERERLSQGAMRKARREFTKQAQARSILSLFDEGSGKAPSLA